MTDPQSNQLDMLLVLRDYYNAHKPAIDAVPILALNFPKIATNIAVINSNLAGQSANIKGVAQTKTNLRTNLNELTFNILNIARAWAVAEENATLAEEFYVTDSGLKKIKDDTMAAYCTHRYELVNDNLLAMADYGITAATMSTWQDAITDYDGAVATPREAVNTKSTHTDNLKTVFDDTMKLLKENIDPVMLNFKTSDVALYNGYVKARIIIDRKGPGSGTVVPSTIIELGIYTYDVNTEVPLAGVVFRVLNAPEGGTLSVTTDEEGLAALKVMGFSPNADATLEMEAEADGYETLSGTLDFTAGNFYSVDIPMVPLVGP